MSGEDAEFDRLMQRLRARDAGAYDALLDRYGAAILRAVRRHLHGGLRPQFESLDFVQDVWTSFVALSAERYTFSDPEALGRFLARVARNKVIEVYRRRFQSRGRDITREERLASTGGECGSALVDRQQPSPSQVAMAGECWDELARTLSKGHRAIAERLREGHTHEEVAAMLGVNVRTVERVVRRLKEFCAV